MNSRSDLDVTVAGDTRRWRLELGCCRRVRKTEEVERKSRAEGTVEGEGGGNGFGF